MLKILFTLFLIAIAIFSVIILITFNNLNRLILFITLSLNIILLILIIFYIQSIGLNILTFSLVCLFLNNIFLCFARLLINEDKINKKYKESLILLLQFYIQIFYIYPNFILRYILTTINQILNIFNNRVNNMLYIFKNIEGLKLIDTEFDEQSHCTLFTFENNKLLDHKNLLVALFIGLRAQEAFSKSGKKIMIVSISSEDKSFYIHKNIIIDENTTIFNYLEKIKNNIQTFYESGYPIYIFNILQVRILDYDTPKLINRNQNYKNPFHKFKRSFYSSCIIKQDNKNLIKPLKTPKTLNKELIATIDVETIDLNNNQFPISLSFSYYLNNQLITIFELIDYNLFLTNPEEGVKNL
jgi:hypothetical protein